MIIAEIGSNHNGSLKTAVESMRVAIECGADLVKFQAYITDQFINKKRHPKHYKVMKQFQFPPSWYYALHLDKVFYTPFSVDMVKFLEEEMPPKYYKIASGDCVYKPLVQRVAKTGKPTFMSNGGCSPEEVTEAERWFVEAGGTHLTIMECTMAYPAKEVFLGEIRNRVMGYSNHVMDVAVPAFAKAMGACAIEMHFKRHDMDTPDNGHSFNPEQFKEAVRLIKLAEKCSRLGIHPHDEELETMELARRKKDGLR